MRLPAEIAAKQPGEAVKTLERAVAAGADTANVRYNLACAYLQAGRTEDALGALEAASTKGFADGKAMAEDPDLAPLRPQPRFKALLARLTGK